jgi:hypothetical protein
VNGELLLGQSHVLDNSVSITDAELIAPLSSGHVDENIDHGLDCEGRIEIQSGGVEDSDVDFTSTYTVGENVEGMFRGGERWYSCVIKKRNFDGTYDLAYDDGDEENNVSEERIRKRRG